MGEGERPKSQVGGRVGDRAEGELYRVDHRVDADCNHVEFFAAAVVAVLFARNFEKKVFGRLKRLATEGFTIIVARYLLLNKRTKEMSVVLLQQCYLFIVKYLVFLFEVFELYVAAVVLSRLPLVFLIVPEEVGVDEEHPGDRDKGHHYAEQVQAQVRQSVIGRKKEDRWTYGGEPGRQTGYRRRKVGL